MKKFMLIAMALMFSIAMYAQDEVTQFLGILVDGSKSEMIKKLKAKGFSSTSFDSDILEGEFNGSKVHIHVVTNNNKVWRIMVSDVNHIDETAIRIRFNRLCRQFENNSKYYVPEDYTISDDENIAYEIGVHKKRYEAVYYQYPIISDTVAFADNVKSELLSKYTEEELENPTKELQSTMLYYLLEKMQIYKRPVWFKISDYYGKYYILMYYDNEYNCANGEDL